MRYISEDDLMKLVDEHWKLVFRVGCAFGFFLGVLASAIFYLLNS